MTSYDSKIKELTTDISKLSSTISYLKQHIKDQERQMRRDNKEIMEMRERYLANDDRKVHLVRIRDEEHNDIYEDLQGARNWEQANEQYEYLKKKMENGEVEGLTCGVLEWEWCNEYELTDEFQARFPCEQFWEQERSETIRVAR